MTGEMIITCEICSHSCPDYDNWTSHLITRAHQSKSIKLITDWKLEDNERAFIVTNSNKIPRDTFEIFTQYGLIADFLVIDSNDMEKKSSLWSYVIQYDSVGSCEQALEFLNPLKNFFGNRVQLDKKVDVSKENLNALLKQRGVEIQKHVLRSRDPFFELHDNLCIKISKLDRANQFDEFIKRISMSFENLCLRKEIIDDMAEYINNIREFRDAKAYIFGSCLTKLGDNFSDIDVYLDVYGRYSGEKANNFISNDDEWPKIKILKRIRNYLRSLRDRNGSLLFPYGIFIHARVPITQMTHQSGVKVDISCENLMSVMNSQLILFYTKYDPRVKNLIQFIRFWATFHGLIGSNLIKNYALTLLVLVFLMKKKIIPPVHLLQSPDLETDPPMTVDCWNIDFCEDIEKVRATMMKEYYEEEEENEPDVNNMLTEEPKQNGLIPRVSNILLLAKEFFRMYSQFNYKEDIICTLIGDSLPRSIFDSSNVEKLPSSLERYKQWISDLKNKLLAVSTPICLQDPFNLSVNVTTNVNALLLNEFKRHCSETIFEIDEYMSNESTTNLMDIFLHFPRTFMQSSSSFKKSKNERIMARIRENIGKNNPTPTSTSISISTTENHDMDMDQQNLQMGIISPEIQTTGILVNNKSLGLGLQKEEKKPGQIHAPQPQPEEELEPGEIQSPSKWSSYNSQNEKLVVNNSNFPKISDTAGVGTNCNKKPNTTREPCPNPALNF